MRAACTALLLMMMAAAWAQPVDLKRIEREWDEFRQERNLPTSLVTWPGLSFGLYDFGSRRFLTVEEMTFDLSADYAPTGEWDFSSATLITSPTREVFIPAWMFAPRLTAGAAAGMDEYETNDVTVDFYVFSDTTPQGVQLMWSYPPDWDGGDISARAYWTLDEDAGDAGDVVVWAFSAKTRYDNDLLDAAWNSDEQINDEMTAFGELHVSPATDNITVAPSGTGGLVMIQVVRVTDDIDDNLAADVRLLGIAIQYRTSTVARTPW